MNSNELYDILQNLNISLKNVLKYENINNENNKLERFLYSLEKVDLKFMRK